MDGYLNKIGLHGHPFDTDVRVLKEPRNVPYRTYRIDWGVVPIRNRWTALVAAGRN